MKTVMVTGSTGALGQAVTTHLRNDRNVRVVATSLYCDEDSDDRQLDVRNPAEVSAIVKNTKPDMILHLAATFEDNFDEAYAVNVEGARHLLDIIHQSRNRTRVLLIGSAAEYGAVRREENPIREDHLLSPVSIYGLTKAWQTQLAGLYANRGVDVVVARVFNLDGPRLSERLFVGQLQKQIAEVLDGRKSIIETGSLSAIRDYVSTDEAANQILAIAEYGEPGRVYHVASGKPVRIRDILSHYLSIYKIDTSIVREGRDLMKRSGYDVPEIYADITNTLKLMRVGRVRVEA